MFTIEESIERATTLPPEFYRRADVWELCKERIFAKQWLFIGREAELLNGSHNLIPLTLLPGFLDEPVFLSKTKNVVRCFTNVCTHRGFLLIHNPESAHNITCKYHGRRFDLNGRFEFMPEFNKTLEFPRPCDHLQELTLENWRGFFFTAIDPDRDFADMKKYLDKRLYFLPVETFKLWSQHTKTYHVKAHWALYCDNFLEGFHIPFVHRDLNKILNYGKYSTDLYQQMVLQTGYAESSELIFDLPKGHPDYGQNITAYYYWIYPNLMLNFYPWGLQLNLVKPLTPESTQVEFSYYVHDEALFQKMNAANLGDATEMEDEFVVEAVQRGIKSRNYEAGRFSATRERGVHFFHRLIAESLTRQQTE